MIFITIRILPLCIICPCNDIVSRLHLSQFVESILKIFLFIWGFALELCLSLYKAFTAICSIRIGTWLFQVLILVSADDLGHILTTQCSKAYSVRTRVFNDQSATVSWCYDLSIFFCTFAAIRFQSAYRYAFPLKVAMQVLIACCSELRSHIVVYIKLLYYHRRLCSYHTVISTKRSSFRVY